MEAQHPDVMDEIRDVLSEVERSYRRRRGQDEEDGLSLDDDLDGGVGLGGSSSGRAEEGLWAGPGAGRQDSPTPAPSASPFGAPGVSPCPSSPSTVPSTRLAAPFDLFVMVDWSAASRRKRGQDSTWLAVGTSVLQSTVGTWNPSSRCELHDMVRKVLDVALQRDLRVLLGYDFAFGYPAGFANWVKGAPAAAQGAKPNWRDVWQWLASSVKDTPPNVNNRFQVADALNAQHKTAFFWGCPPGLKLKSLSTNGNPPNGMNPNPLQPNRATEFAALAQLKQHGRPGAAKPV
jgi:hypothetical protein